METVRQACPQCGATLELPAAAIGRKARCPSCQATFVVAPASSPANHSLQSSVNPSAVPPSTAMPPGEEVSAAPPSKPREPFSGASGEGFGMPVQRPSAAADNPYAVGSGMSAAALEPTEPGELVIQTPSIDSIVSAATAIFTERWQPLVIAGLIMFGISLVIGIFGGILAVIAVSLDLGLEIALSFVAQCVIGFTSYYLTLGMMRVALAVARGREVTALDIFVAPPVFGRVLLPVSFLVLVGAAAQMGVTVVVGERPGLEGVIPALATSMVTGLMFALLLLVTWPLFYVACDGRASNLSAVAIGFRIGRSNLINSLLLVVIAMALGIANLVTCGLGSIVTQPILILLGAIGYLMMTSQPVSDPSQPSLGQVPLGYGNPGYGNTGYGDTGYGNKS